MISVIIFDMDGVLADSEVLYRRMNQSFILSRGGDLSRLDYDKYIGSHAWDMWADLKSIYGLAETVGDLVELEKKAKHQLLRSADLQPVSGAVSLVRNLRNDGFDLAVASSSLRINVELVLDRLELISFFKHIVTGDDVENGKPAPDIFLKAAAHFNAEPENCAVIEDSANGVLAAHRAGMMSVGLSSPSSGNQSLDLADLVVDDLSLISTAMFRS